MFYFKRIVKQFLFLLGMKRYSSKIKSLIQEELSNILEKQKLNFIDVGGAVNLQPHHQKLIGNANFYIFEPDNRSYNDLVETVDRHSHPEDFFYINKALSGQNGKRILYLSNVPTGTSILKLNNKSVSYFEGNDYFFPMKELEIDTFTLTTVLDELGINHFDAIKLDVQGAELEIIKGIDDERLDEVSLIELEVGLNDIYLDQANFSDVSEFMKSKGFTLFDLRLNRASFPNGMDKFSYHKALDVHDQSPAVASRVCEFDAVFFRDISWIKKNKIDKKRILRIIALYCTYNYYAEAFQLTNYLLSNKQITGGESESILNAIKKCCKRENAALIGFERSLKKNNYYTWGQYMWVPYPSN